MNLVGYYSIKDVWVPDPVLVQQEQQETMPVLYRKLRSHAPRLAEMGNALHVCFDVLLSQT